MANRIALFESAALILVLAQAVPAMARAEEASAPAAPSASASSEVGEVVVTGTRLKGVAPVGSALLGVGRNDIEQSNAVTTSQLFLNLPQVNNLGVSETVRSGNGGSANFNFSQGLNVHAIGPYATLLLVDGQRVTPQGVYGLTIDTSIVPTIALERLELVPDGASAIYGSDAIAGVANLILRRKFDGLEMSGTYGFADGYHQYQASVIAGKNWGSGYGTLTYSYNGHSELKASDRSFARADLTARGGSDFRSTQCNPGTIVIGGVNYPIPTGGVTPATANRLQAGAPNRCDNFAGGYLLPDIRRNNVVATINQDVADWLSLSGTGLYARREIGMRVGFAPTTLTIPTTNAFFVRPPGAAATAETIRYSFTDLPQSPVGNGISEFSQGTVGAVAKLPRGWEATGTVTIGHSNEVFRQEHVANTAALNAALASSNPATAFNPYGGANSASVIAAIGNGVQSYKGNSRLEVADLSASGSLFRLPGGDVKLAVGYQHQSNRQIAYSFTGNTSVRTYSVAINFTRRVDSAYGELLIPLVGSDNAIPGVRSLQLDVAGRYDHYSDVGSTTNPKVGLNWEVVDGVRLHASYGTSFRAPPVYQVHGTASSFITTLSDPLLGGASTTVLEVAGGKEGISPETAHTYSVGADFTPRMIAGLTGQVSYFHVNYKDIITALGNNSQLLNQRYYSALGIITRNPTPAQVAATLAAFPLVAGVVPSTVPVLIDARTRNLAALNASGVDFLVNYEWSTERAGAFNVGVTGSYYIKFGSTAVPGAPEVDLAGTILNPPKYQMRPYLGWRWQGLNTRATLDLIDSYTNNLAAPAQKVSRSATLDLHVDYDIGSVVPGATKAMRLALDVTNLFDKSPPFANVGPSAYSEGGYDAALFSPVGRIVAISLTADF